MNRIVSSFLIKMTVYSISYEYAWEIFPKKPGEFPTFFMKNEGIPLVK